MPLLMNNTTRLDELSMNIIFTSYYGSNSVVISYWKDMIRFFLFVQFLLIGVYGRLSIIQPIEFSVLTGKLVNQRDFSLCSECVSEVLTLFCKELLSTDHSVVSQNFSLVQSRELQKHKFTYRQQRLGQMGTKGANKNNKNELIVRESEFYSLFKK